MYREAPSSMFALAYVGRNADYGASARRSRVMAV